MKTSDFRHAAKKHFSTCKFMLASLSGYRSDRKHIESNVYYLSGYIIECISKYAILQHMHKDNVVDEELNDFGLKNHNIKQLFCNLLDKIEVDRDFPRDFPKHYRQWDVGIRYESCSSHTQLLGNLDKVFKSFVEPYYKALDK